MADPLTDEQFAEFVGACCDLAAFSLANCDHDEDPLPTMVMHLGKPAVEGEKGQLVVAAFDPRFMRSEEEKDKLVETQRKMLEDSEPVACAWSALAWMVKYDKAEQSAMDMQKVKDSLMGGVPADMRPVNHPRRQEVFILQALCRRGGTPEHRVFTADVVRSDESPTLGPWEDMTMMFGEGTTTGRMVEHLMEGMTDA